MKKAFNLICGQPWAITQEALARMLAIAKREQHDLEAVEAQRSQRLANTSSVTERGGVAILPVSGPIFRYANLFSDISGATSIQLLARDFTTALNDPTVKAIVLSIDSPGGEVNGVNEFAEMVYAARGKKPIVAYVGGTGASAAYWIASAADEVVADGTAILGSIGVVAALPAPDEDGDIVFVSSQSPRKRPDPTTAEGAADIQDVIDATAEVFVQVVARNRGVSAERVLSSFGQGGVFVGEAAVKAGLADRLGSFEGVLASLASPQRAQPVRIAASTAPVTPELVARMHKHIDMVRDFSGTLASGGARVDTHKRKQPKELTRMDEETIVQDVPAPPLAAPPLPPINDAAMQAQINAYVAQMEARYQAQQEATFQRAQAEFERRIADMEARRQIEAYAQHVTTPTVSRPHSLPIEAEALTTILAETPGPARAKWQALLDKIVTTGFVDYSEYGSAADAAPEQSAKEQFDAAVNTRVATGLSRLSAIQAVAKEQPALYEAYQTESLTPKKGGR